MDNSATTVFIIDDDASVRRSLKRLVSAAGWHVEEFGAAPEFLRAASAYETVGCLILDVRMPGMSGPELQEQMARKGLSFPIVFLTGEGDIPTSVRAMKQGAVDFLTKPVDAQALLQAVELAIAQHASVRDQARQRRVTERTLASLSAREREVMEYVINGYLNKQIAAELGISEKTVKVHRSRVMEKLALRSVAELVRLCEGMGIAGRDCRSAAPAQRPQRP